MARSQNDPRQIGKVERGSSVLLPLVRFENATTGCLFANFQSDSIWVRKSDRINLKKYENGSTTVHVN